MPAAEGWISVFRGSISSELPKRIAVIVVAPLKPFLKVTRTERATIFITELTARIIKRDILPEIVSPRAKSATI